jgi:hypothetical protein
VNPACISGCEKNRLLGGAALSPLFRSLASSRWFHAITLMNASLQQVS